MKILLRYCYFWGNYTTHLIEISQTMTLDEFKILISNKFSIPLVQLLIKFWNDDFLVFHIFSKKSNYDIQIRLNDDFPLNFYLHDNETIVFIDKIEKKEETTYNFVIYVPLFLNNFKKKQENSDLRKFLKQVRHQSFLPEEQLLDDDCKLEYIRNSSFLLNSLNFTEFDLDHYIKMEIERLIKVILFNNIYNLFIFCFSTRNQEILSN